MATKKRAQKKPKPYNPAGITQYPSEKAFNQTVNTRAQAQLKPTLDDIRSRRTEEIGANATRNRDIQGYYGYDMGARQAAQTRMQEALTGILSAAGVSNTGAQAGLSAALRPAADANSAAATQLGVQAPGVDPQLANVLASYGRGNQNSLAGDFGAYLTRSAADIGLTGIEEREAGEREMGTHKANMTALDKERTAARGQLPGLREGARSSLLQELLANSQNKLAWNQFGENRSQGRAQQRLAEDQFGLAEDQFGLTEDQFKESKRARRFDEKQAREASKLSRDQLDLAHEELDAKVDQAQTEEEVVAAGEQAKRFDSAAEYLQGYLSPGDQDMRYNAAGKKVFSPKMYKTRVNANKFHEVLTNLMTTYGLDQMTAYQVMRTAPIFRARAERFIPGLEAGINTRPTGGNEGGAQINYGSSTKKKKAKKK